MGLNGDNEYVEEQLRETMDGIWHSLTPEEIKIINSTPEDSYR